MTSISKSCLIILISLTLLTLATGCGKPELSEMGHDITCYAATYSKGIYKSDNGGTSWYPIDPDHEDLYLYFKKVFLSPDKRALYVTTTGAGLFVIDPETGFVGSIHQFKDDNVRAVAFNTVSTGEAENIEILAGMDNRGIFIKRNGAGNWEDFNKGLAYHDVNVIIVHGQDIFAGTLKGVFRWDDASKEWRGVSEGIKNRNITSMGVDPHGDIMYAGSGTFLDEKGLLANISCLYKSSDQGKTWKASDRGLPDKTLVYAIAVNEKKPDRIYLGTSEGIFRSTNNGKKWHRIDNGLPDGSRVFDIKIVHTPDEKDLVYAAGSSGVFMAPDDKKALWSDRSYGLERTNITSIVLGSSPN
jgi:photosystem II stability/assembly factor-like uncharacterized protein